LRTDTVSAGAIANQSALGYSEAISSSREIIVPTLSCDRLHIECGRTSPAASADAIAVRPDQRSEKERNNETNCE